MELDKNLTIQLSAKWQVTEYISHIKKASFPIVIAFSGGKDSVALVLSMLELGIDKKRLHLHHHLVDGKGETLFDWPCTEKYCKAFAQAFDLKLYYSYRKGGIVREILRENEPRQDIMYQQEPGGKFHRLPSDKTAINTRRKFPAVSTNLIIRWCSSTVKIEVLGAIIRHHPAYQRKLLVLTGERAQESTAREKYSILELHTCNTKSRKVVHCRPLLHWNELGIWNIMARWNVQPHPAYMLGWNRCSCQLCIFSSPNLWATINLISPQKVALIDSLEAKIDFTLYHKTPIYEKVSKGIPLKDLSPYWITQALKNYDAPIITTDKWVLPPGAYTKEKAGAN